MKLSTLKNNVVIETEITKDMYGNVVAAKPEAFTLVDEDKRPYFGIGLVPNGREQFDMRGIMFTKADPSGKLFVSFQDSKLPTGDSKQKEYLKKTYGGILIRLMQVEAQVAAAASTITADLASIDDAINTDAE